MKRLALACSAASVLALGAATLPAQADVDRNNPNVTNPRIHATIPSVKYGTRDNYRYSRGFHRPYAMNRGYYRYPYYGSHYRYPGYAYAPGVGVGFGIGGVDVGIGVGSPYYYYR